MGCSSLASVINPVSAVADAVLPSDKPSIEVQAQVGKTNTITKGLVTTDSGDKIDADSIGTIDKSLKNNYDSVDTIETTNTNVPWWVLLMVAFMKPLVVIKDAITLFRKPKAVEQQ